MPVAFVVARTAPPVDAAELVDYCAARLASFKVPRDVRFLEALPRNAMGKVEKKRLV